MNRPLLEKASWIAGILSALVAIWVVAFPSGQAKEEVNKPPAAKTVQPQSTAIPTPIETSVPLSTSIAGAKNSDTTCVGTEVILALLKQASNMSTFDARDSAYRSLVADAVCINDLDLATRIANLSSTYATRDELYQQVLDAAITTNNSQLVDRLPGLMSTYKARDEARKKIMTALRHREK
jgi:hypothetical protein